MFGRHASCSDVLCRAARLLQPGVLLADGDPQSGVRFQDSLARDLQARVLVRSVRSLVNRVPMDAVNISPN
jgi:hypothetical protein